MSGPVLGALLAASHPTIPDTATFLVCALIIVGGAIGVVTARNSVHAALSLVMTLFGVAILFIEQDAQFLAVVQILVYAGAIVVLFLFVIMFLGVDRRENVAAEPLKGQRPLAFALMAIAVGGVIALGVNAHWATGAHSVAGSTTVTGKSNTYLLGQSLFTTYLFPFEITAGLLVIAVVGAVVLARRPSRGSSGDGAAPSPRGAEAPRPAKGEGEQTPTASGTAAGTGEKGGAEGDGGPKSAGDRRDEEVLQ
jgi:NADH-quinone oxidoreductase subunit J